MRPDPGERAWAPLVLGLAALLWLLNHMYSGIRHDGIVYALLARHWLDSAAYARDLFFLYGSQDAFSLFSPLYGTLISLFGHDLASRVIVLAGALGWIGASFLLARAALGCGLASAFATLFLAALSISYAPNGETFTFNESFATARSLAMPLGLASLATVARGRMGLALGLAVASALLHPLVGIGCIGVVVAHEIGAARTLLGCFVLAVLTVGLKFVFGVQALESMNPSWLITVRNSTRDVLVGPLGTFRLNEYGVWLAVLFAGASYGREEMRRLYLAALVVVGAGVVLAVMVAWVLPIAVLVQAQPWRVIWIAVVLGVVAAADVATLAARQEAMLIVYLLCLLVGYLLPDYSALTIIAVLAGLRASAIKDRVVAWITRWPQVSWGTVAILAMMAAPGYWADMDIIGAGLSGGDGWHKFDVLRGLLLGGGGVGTLLLVQAVRIVSTRLPLVGFLLIFVAAATSLIAWDQRPMAFRNDEARLFAAPGSTNLSGGFIKKGDVVAWPQHAKEVWFMLGTANYVDTDQLIGMVFSQDKAREWERRMTRVAMARYNVGRDLQETSEDEVMAALRVQVTQRGLSASNLFSYATETIPVGAVVSICADQSLDWIIVDDSGMAESGTKPPLARMSWSGRTWGLYSCNDYRGTGRGGADR